MDVGADSEPPVLRVKAKTIKVTFARKAVLKSLRDFCAVGGDLSFIRELLCRSGTLKGVPVPGKINSTYELLLASRVLSEFSRLSASDSEELLNTYESTGTFRY